jgi:6-pyruvoyltetrahydropterin/6-carboxytetrahydropterin synthase
MPTCTRRLTFAAGHRVLGHEGKCQNPHGHNYAVEITVSGKLDALGCVVDFGVVKELVGEWIEANLDHAFLVNRDDQELLDALDVNGWPVYQMDGNPTAENIALMLFKVAGDLLAEKRVAVERVRVHETENCYADVSD